MPYYLNNASSASAAVNIPQITIGATVGDYIEIKAVANSGNTTNTYRVFGDRLSGSFTNFVEISPTQVLLRANSGTNLVFNSGYTQPSVGSIFTLRLTKSSSTQWSALLNGSSIGTATSSGSLIVNGIGRISNTTTECFRGGFYYVAISDNGGASATRYYDPSGTSSGTTLFDTASGQNGTQVGTWPANDSEWVFYSSGGTAYADLLNGAAFSSSVGTLVSSIAHLDALVGATYTSSIGTLASSTAHTDVLSGVSYTSSINSLNATRGYGDTLSGLTYSASVGQLDARRGYSSLLVGGSYAYTVGNLESTNTSAAGRDDALQGVNLSFAVGSLVSTVQRNTTLAGLSYTSAVGNLSASLAYNSALLGLTYSASVNTLLHTWSGEVTVTIEGYTIRYADSIVAAAYANDIISAGYAADILERITWQH